jgi:hypothetical protein
VPPRRHDPKRNPHCDRDNQCGKCELDRHREPLDDDVADRTREADGLSEIPAEDIAEVDPQLDIDRLVQTVDFVEPFTRLGGGPLTEQRRTWVARHKADQEEDNEQHPDQHGYGDEEASEDVADHFR